MGWGKQNEVVKRGERGQEKQSKFAKQLTETRAAEEERRRRGCGVRSHNCFLRGQGGTDDGYENGACV